MRGLSIAPAILLAAWLAPLTAQVGVVLQLLDAGEALHSPVLIEFLVHGHPHGRQVPAHGHTVREGSSARFGVRETTTPPRATMLTGGLTAPTTPAREGLFTEAVQALASAPPRHLLLGTLRR